MSITETKDFVKKISCVSQELKEKLEIVESALTTYEREMLTIIRKDNEDIWDFLEKIFEKDKDLDDIIDNLYLKRKAKISENMSTDILTQKNFHNYCVFFYNMKNTISFIDMIEENMKNNKDGINNDKILLATGFATGTISRILNVLPSIELKGYSTKIYNILVEYMRIYGRR